MWDDYYTYRYLVVEADLQSARKFCMALFSTWCPGFFSLSLFFPSVLIFPSHYLLPFSLPFPPSLPPLLSPPLSPLPISSPPLPLPFPFLPPSSLPLPSPLLPEPWAGRHQSPHLLHPPTEAQSCLKQPHRSAEYDMIPFIALLKAPQSPLNSYNLAL